MRKIITCLLLIGSINLSSAQTDFSQENAEKILKILTVDIGPRPMGSPSEQRALKFAVEKFKSFGCDTSYIMPMTYTSHDNTNSGIAIGIKRGLTKRIIVIGGHIDSAGPEIPGADDNGSGSAVVLETARVLCQKDLQSTIVFALFGGEEQGLEGSKYFVDFFPEIDSVVLMLNVDMANGIGRIEIDTDAYRASSPKWLVKAAIEEYNFLGYKELIYPTHAQALNKATKRAAGSDHQPFLTAGIPAIAFITDITKPIHTPQDNFKNFDPRGLKRSCDVVIKLAERFDVGVPSVETEEYWLYVLGKTPIFLPIWSLTAFIVFAIIVGIISFILIRKRRLIVTPSPIIDDVTNKIIPHPRKWSGLKVLLLTIFPTISFVFAPDLIGWLKGLKIPWSADVNAYLFYSIVFAIIGFWISFRLGTKLKLSNCPYFFYKRAAIILLIFIIPLSIVNINLGIYPAIALIFISLAAVIRVQILKIIFFILSSLWMYRLIFSEWYPFTKRMTFFIAENLNSFIINIGTVIFFIIFSIPFFFAFASVYRETPLLKPVVEKFKTVKVLIFILITIVLFSIYLLTEPSYNDKWYKNVRVIQTYNLDDKKFNIQIKSSEYLDSIKSRHTNKDTLLLGNFNYAKIIPQNIFADMPIDTNRFKITREVATTKSNDTTYFSVNISILSKLKPYNIKITYKNSELIRNLETNYKFTEHNGKIELNWYSFPEVPLKIPLKFFITGNDTVRENIKMTYADLFYPMELERDKTNFIKRTEIKQSWKYSFR